MKKILVGLLLFGLFGFLAAPGLALAQPTIPEACTIDYPQRITNLTGEAPSGTNGLHCLLDTVITVRMYTFYFFLVVALIMILVGAFQFVTAGGNEEKTARARNILIYAVVGIAVAYLARILLSLAERMVAG